MSPLNWKVYRPNVEGNLRMVAAFRQSDEAADYVCEQPEGTQVRDARNGRRVVYTRGTEDTTGLHVSVAINRSQQEFLRKKRGANNA